MHCNHPYSWLLLFNGKQWGWIFFSGVSTCTTLLWLPPMDLKSMEKELISYQNHFNTWTAEKNTFWYMYCGNFYNFTTYHFILHGGPWRKAINHSAHWSHGQAFGGLHRSLDLYMDDSNGKSSCVHLWHCSVG